MSPHHRSNLASLALVVVTQVEEGDVEVVNIRATDGRLGPLIGALVALGIVTLLATLTYWWTTRPARTPYTPPVEGAHDG